MSADKISGYGEGGTETVLSVDAVAREAEALGRVTGKWKSCTGSILRWARGRAFAL